MAGLPNLEVQTWRVAIPDPAAAIPGPLKRAQSQKEVLAGGITIGNVQGTGVVIGHGSSASAAPDQPSSAQHDAAGLFDSLIRQLEQYEDSVVDLADIRDLAEAARAEMLKPSPRRPVVRRLLEGVAARVAGVCALTEAINNIRVLVEHLP